jgi:hypothetical protein
MLLSNLLLKNSLSRKPFPQTLLTLKLFSIFVITQPLILQQILISCTTYYKMDLLIWLWLTILKKQISYKKCQHGHVLSPAINSKKFSLLTQLNRKVKMHTRNLKASIQPYRKWSINTLLMTHKKNQKTQRKCFKIEILIKLSLLKMLNYWKLFMKQPRFISITMITKEQIFVWT